MYLLDLEEPCQILSLSGAQVQRAHGDLGLEVHGLLVGRDDEGGRAMQDLCTHLHHFKSWTAIGGRY